VARLIDKLVGHREAIGALLKAKELDRLASTLLFAGPGGVGKRLAAMALSQALVCEMPENGGPEKVCGVCGACLRIEKAQSESLLVVSPDGTGIKIEQARDVLQWISLQKMGRSRIVIIDQAHLMNPQTANALLKSLEEPPAGTYFILITPLAASMLATIRSRAQLVRFRPLTNDELTQILGPESDPWVIESAQGSVENAQRLMEDREDFLDLEVAVLAYLEASFMQFPAPEVAKLKELTKERTAQGFVSGLIQGAIRDGLRIQAGLRPVRDGKWQNLTLSASVLPARKLGALADYALKMENEMGRNIDRGLLLENFALQLKGGKNV
jgi:DNA polymerase-3 subunit delta'